MASDLQEVKEYRITVHGVDGEQYFQGHGVSNSQFEDCATGVGDDASDAFDDALDSLAQNGWDTSTIEGLDWGDPDDTAHVKCECQCDFDCTSECCNPDGEFDEHSHCTMVNGCDCPCHDECDLHYYVSVDVLGVD